MKKILLIGAAGFVGPYLYKNLKDHGYEVVATKTKNEMPNNDIEYIDLDILNKEEIHLVLKDINPDYVINLAAQSSVKMSWINPSLTFNVNVMGLINILEAIRIENLSPRILLIGSSEEYGENCKDDVNEEVELKPNNFYALTKKMQEEIADIYVKRFNFDIVLTRSFNHIGVGQNKGFVVSDFAHQIVDIEKNEGHGEILVGNLKAKRDFSNVKDVVNAYRLLLEKGKKGEIYNVGSGKSYSIEYILNTLLSYSPAKISVKIDENKFRPIDTEYIKADITKLKKDTNIEFEYSLEETLKEIIDHLRKN